MPAISRTYRMKFTVLIRGAFFALAGVILRPLFEEKARSGDGFQLFFYIVIPVALIVFGLLTILRALQNRVCLTDTAIEVQGLFESESLPLEKISGRRRYTTLGKLPERHMVLVSNENRFEKLDIEEVYRFDQFFYDWFNAFPDLDELEPTGPKPSDFELV